MGVLTERLMEVTEVKVSEEHGGLKKGKGCVDQIFAVKVMIEEYLGKGEKLYAVLIDLEKYMKKQIRDLSGKFLKFMVLEGSYWEASACVKIDGELSEFSYRSGSETKICDIAMDVYYFYG